MTSPGPQMQGVILVGFMGAGKSSVGRILAQRLGWTFDDLDDWIERRENQKIPEIFRNAGEVGFRRAEHEALRELLQALQSGLEKVIALGGGAFSQESNVRLIEAAKLPIVFLDAQVDELWQRCQRQAEVQGLERPLRGNVEAFRGLYEKRQPHYLKAKLRIETDGNDPAEIAEDLIKLLGLTSGERRGETN